MQQNCGIMTMIDEEEAKAKEISLVTEIAILKRDILNLEQLLKIEKIKLSTTHNILMELNKNNSGCC
jgi:hypothetical protein